MDNPPNHTNNTDENKDRIGDINYVVNLPTPPKKTGTLIAAIVAAICAAASAYFAWYQIDIFKGYTRVQNRAYIIVTNITPYKWDVGDTVKFIAVIKNIGQTPAYNVIPRASTMFSPELQEKEPIDAPVLDKSVFVAAPNDTLSFLGSGNVVLDTISTLFMISGELKLFAYFSVEYDDVFGDSHRTVACCEFDPIRLRFDRKGKFNYQN